MPQVFSSEIGDLCNILFWKKKPHESLKDYFIAFIYIYFFLNKLMNWS